MDGSKEGTPAAGDSQPTGVPQDERRRPPSPPRGGLSDEQRSERLRGQVGIVTGAFDPDEVFVWRGKDDAPGEVEFMCRNGHVLVRDTDVQRAIRALGGGREASSLIDGVTLLALPAGMTVPAAMELLDGALGAGVATPDHVLYVTGATGSCCPATEPAQPSGKEPLPALNKVGADIGDGAGVLVSVVDTGWHSPAASHPATPWLAGVTGDEEVIDPKDIHAYAGHGTFIAGVVRCVAPAAEVHVEGFLPNGGAVFESAIVVQLYDALSRGPDIISLSAGAHTRNHHRMLGFDAFYDSALRHLKGTVLVAAAGNDANRIPFWPAAFPWAVSVGALDAALSARAGFSNFGSWVDLYTAGVDLVNAFPTGTYVCKEPPHVGEVRTFDGLASWSGTSFATPTVAGIIAARMSRTGESARAAADALLAIGSQAAIPGIGSVVSPGPQNLPT